MVVSHYHSNGVPGQEPFAYVVVLDRGGDACYAPIDHPEIIRAAVSTGEVYWNARTNAMEVAAKARLALHPSSSRLAKPTWSKSSSTPSR